jgi:hypothetical protein
MMDCVRAEYPPRCRSPRTSLAGSLLVGMCVCAHAMTVAVAHAGARPPVVTDGPPAAGRRVRVTPPEHTGTPVHHTLWLPADWTAEQRDAGRRWPVVIEYPGNHHPPSGSAGTVEGALLGRGLTRGAAIWAVLPCVEADGRSPAATWWGDVETTVAYAKRNVPRICREFGGDPDRVLLCGFSRGAIATSFIGLADDEIATLWCGFVTHDHFDGVREWPGTAWGAPLEHYRGQARTRLERLRGRPLLVCQAGGTGDIRAWLTATGLPLDAVTFLDVQMHEIFPVLPREIAPGLTVTGSHTDRWLLVDCPETRTARDWVADLLDDLAARRIRKPETPTLDRAGDSNE